jgi:hypothetical protein
MTGQFEIDDQGRPVPNAYVPCEGCGEACPMVILHGDGLDIARDPNVRVWCPKCWAVQGAEEITQAAAESEEGRGHV